MQARAALNWCAPQMQSTTNRNGTYNKCIPVQQIHIPTSVQPIHKTVYDSEQSMAFCWGTAENQHWQALRLPLRQRQEDALAASQPRSCGSPEMDRRRTAQQLVQGSQPLGPLVLGELQGKEAKQFPLQAQAEQAHTIGMSGTPHKTMGVKAL